MPTHDLFGTFIGDWSLQNGHIGAVALRISMSFVMAAIVGIERAAKRHFAGLRTFILSALTAVFAALGDLYMLEVFKTRITVLTAAVLAGMAILNSNTILYSSRNQLTGLTTSVALWATSAISACLGFGMYTPALIGFVAILISLALFPSLEAHFKGRSRHFEIHVELRARDQMTDFISALRQVGLHVDGIESNPAYANTGLAVFSVKLTIRDTAILKKQRRQIIDALSALKYVHFVEEL